MGPIVWIIGAAAGAVGFLLFAGGSKRTNLAEFAGKLKDSRPGGPPSAPQDDVFAVLWETPGSVTDPNALEFVRQQIAQGRSVWNDLTLLGASKFYLFTTKGQKPAGQGHEFSLLADASDLALVDSLLQKPGKAEGAPAATPGGSQSPIPGGIPIPVPGNAPSDIPPTRREQGEPPKTGIAEVDEKLRSPDTSPAQIRAIADSFRKSNPALAAELDAYAAEVYTKLRAQHTAQGGTPWRVRANDIPWKVARYYSGKPDNSGLAEMQAINPGKTWKDWNIGKTWLLPLAWDVEAKPVYPLQRPEKIAPASVPTSPRPVTIHEANRGDPIKPAEDDSEWEGIAV